MKVTDFHTHFFPDELAPKALAALTDHAPGSQTHTDGTLAGLRDSMKKSRIYRSVTLPVATRAEQVFKINRSLKVLLSDDIMPFGALHPGLQNADSEIEYLKQTGIRGIKLHPEYQDFYVDDRRMYPMYEQLAFSGLIVVFHAGMDPGPFSCDHSLPRSLRTVHQDFPELTMVAAHMGGWKMWEEVEKELCGRDIYFDTSAVSELMSRDAFAQLVRRHGSEHILFGSDSPWFDQGSSFSWVQNCGLAPVDLERIFCDNAANLLGDDKGANNAKGVSPCFRLGNGRSPSTLRRAQDRLCRREP